MNARLFLLVPVAAITLTGCASPAKDVPSVHEVVKPSSAPVVVASAVAAPVEHLVRDVEMNNPASYSDSFYQLAASESEPVVVEFQASRAKRAGEDWPCSVEFAHLVDSTITAPDGSVYDTSSTEPGQSVDGTKHYASLQLGQKYRFNMWSTDKIDVTTDGCTVYRVVTTN